MLLFVLSIKQELNQPRIVLFRPHLSIQRQSLIFHFYLYSIVVLTLEEIFALYLNFSLYSIKVLTHLAPHNQSKVNQCCLVSLIFLGWSLHTLRFCRLDVISLARTSFSDQAAIPNYLLQTYILHFGSTSSAHLF